LHLELEAGSGVAGESDAASRLEEAVEIVEVALEAGGFEIEEAEGLAEAEAGHVDSPGARLLEGPEDGLGVEEADPGREDDEAAVPEGVEEYGIGFGPFVGEFGDDQQGGAEALGFEGFGQEDALGTAGVVGDDEEAVPGIDAGGLSQEAQQVRVRHRVTIP
jgi:hypothetical protein